ncbi:HlyD membrane-fusion protein of T1SS [Seinonella peptonophila]|uniref:HlyD membrane-fusion protein of T1SS n=1 Tax=Seinonella peptonophila TaxID=112248 RepID=A0A1M4Z7K3_9BACL|nr:HlyD family efflux transporter periplasmic adaptor subunit [Seinonella peptonophila]SHF13566.1 HlyD membrane-fusion protein of T1SS [Seinonella peptonophila]
MEQTVEKNRRFPWAISVIVLLVLIGVGVALYMYNQSSLYIQTDNAKLTVDQVTISAKQNSKLATWDIQQGTSLQKNQKLGSEQPLTAGTNPTGQTAQTKQPTASASDIVSPIAGTVIQNRLQAGQSVTQGQPLAVVADLSKVYVLAYVDEDQIHNVAVDKDVDITFDAYKDQTFSGKVAEIGSTAGKFAQSSAILSTSTDKKEMERVPVKIEIDHFSVKYPVIGLNASVKIHK